MFEITEEQEDRFRSTERERKAELIERIRKNAQKHYDQNEENYQSAGSPGSYRAMNKWQDLLDLCSIPDCKLCISVPRIEPGKDLCTLFTCTPYGINTQRLFVRAKRVPNDKIQERRIYYTNEAYRVTPAIVAPILAAPILLFLYVLVLISDIRRKRRLKVQKQNAGKALES